MTLDPTFDPDREADPGTDPDADGDWLYCHRCGALLLDDPDDDPVGGPDASPICGACARTRDEEADLSMLDMRDGSLDGIIEW